ncbi:MAG: NYN domain-containing protein [Chloroflexaceae bacterium]|nr:NYN domain-containing protein [Chloroflexaceae bacterium]
MLYEHRRPDVAVFIDFENVYVSVRDKLDANPNFETIMDRCNDLGRVIIARAYADWYRYPRITSALYANSIEPMYVPTYYYDKDMGRTGRAIKNSVDMNLCIDAMKTLFTNTNVERFVLVTGDRDFIPLVNSIRQQGKEVIIIGIGGAASTHLAQSADEFIFYEQLVGKSTPSTQRKATPPSKPEPVSEPETVRHAPAPAPEPDIYDTLVEAIHLVRERGYVSTLGSLKLVMKELMGGDFKENRYKDINGRAFTKFKEFVQDAERRGKVQIFTSGTVNEVFLPGEDPLKLSQFAGDLKSETPESEEHPVSEPPNGKHAEPEPEPEQPSSSRSRRRRRPRNQRQADRQQAAGASQNGVASSDHLGEAAMEQEPDVEPVEADDTATNGVDAAEEIEPTAYNATPDRDAVQDGSHEELETNIFDSQEIAANAAELAEAARALAMESETYEATWIQEQRADLFMDVEQRARALADTFRQEMDRSANTTTEPVEAAEVGAAEVAEPAESLAAEGQAESVAAEGQAESVEAEAPGDRVQAGRVEAETVLVVAEDATPAEEPVPVAAEAAPTGADASAAEPPQADERSAEEAESQEAAIDFSDEEWQAFRTMMAEYTKPVSFSSIQDRLKELRNEKVFTRTNEQLRTMAKQAITRGLLSRSGRGSRAYYALHTEESTSVEVADDAASDEA